MRLTRRVNPLVGRGGLFEGRRGDVRIAGQVPPSQRRDEDARLPRRDDEAVARLGEREAHRVRAADRRLDRRPVGLDAEIGVGELHRPIQVFSADRAAAGAAADVDPVIRPPLRAVDAALERPSRKALEQHLADLGLAVPVAVGEEEDLRLADGDDPAPRRADPEAGRQAIGPDLRAVHAAVAVDVVQSLDRAVRLGVRSLLVPLVRLDPPHHAVELPGPVQLLDVVLPFQVVAVQLADEESPTLIPAHARGLADERLARHQLDAKPRGYLESPGTLVRGERSGGIVRFRNLAADRARHRDAEQE